MISVDYTVFIQVANFLLLIFLLNKFMFKPIRKVLDQRRDKMNGLGQDIDGARQDARSKLSALEEGLARAKARGLKKKEALTQEAEEKEKAALAEVSAQNQKEIAVMKEKIEKEVARAEEELKGEVNAFAMAISEKILGRAVQ